MKEQIQNKGLKNSAMRGLTPAELVVHNLCKDCENGEALYHEILSEASTPSGDPHDYFNRCLELLKERGLLLY